MVWAMGSFACGIFLSLNDLLKKIILIELSWCPYLKSVGREWRSLSLDFEFYSINLSYATAIASWLQQYYSKC